MAFGDIIRSLPHTVNATATKNITLLASGNILVNDDLTGRYQECDPSSLTIVRNYAQVNAIVGRTNQSMPVRGDVILAREGSKDEKVSLTVLATPSCSAIQIASRGGLGGSLAWTGAGAYQISPFNDQAVSGRPHLSFLVPTGSYWVATRSVSMPTSYRSPNDCLCWTGRTLLHCQSSAFLVELDPVGPTIVRTANLPVADTVAGIVLTGGGQILLSIAGNTDKLYWLEY